MALAILLSTTTLIGVSGEGSVHAQTPAVTPVEGTLTAVAYVEVKAASAEVGRTALRQYRDALGKARAQHASSSSSSPRGPDIS